MRCPHNEWFRLSDYGRVWWWHLESVIATKLARRKRVDKQHGFSLGLFTAALHWDLCRGHRSGIEPGPPSARGGGCGGLLFGWASGRLADRQRGKVSSLPSMLSFRTSSTACVRTHGQLSLLREGTRASRLHFPGFKPKSRQIARRGSALSLPHGILDWSPS